MDSIAERNQASLSWLVPGRVRESLSRGDDTWTGAGNDRLFGEAARDRMIGGTGDDELSGVQDDDIMTGGAGADVFMFRGKIQFFPDYETGVGAGNRDKITDFDPGEGDQLDFTLSRYRRPLSEGRLSRAEIVKRLTAGIPERVNRLTPDGRLSSETEAQRMI